MPHNKKLLQMQPDRHTPVVTNYQKAKARALRRRFSSVLPLICSRLWIIAAFACCLFVFYHILPKITIDFSRFRKNSPKSTKLSGNLWQISQIKVSFLVNSLHYSNIRTAQNQPRRLKSRFLRNSAERRCFSREAVSISAVFALERELS